MVLCSRERHFCSYSKLRLSSYRFRQKLSALRCSLLSVGTMKFVVYLSQEVLLLLFIGRSRYGRRGRFWWTHSFVECDWGHFGQSRGVFPEIWGGLSALEWHGWRVKRFRKKNENLSADGDNFVLDDIMLNCVMYNFVTDAVSRGATQSLLSEKNRSCESRPSRDGIKPSLTFLWQHCLKW